MVLSPPENHTGSLMSATLRPHRVRRVLCAALAGLLLSGGWTSSASAFGRTLDEVFRGTLREEHNGTLPPFVVNRGLAPYPEPKPLTPEEAAELARRQQGVPALDLTGQMSWVEVVTEVAGGAPSPFAVEAVRRRAEDGDGQALELLAWMNANGVGLQRDLGKAFDLYSRAHTLGIQGAKDNAQAIYRSMSVGERRTVFNPF